jgi:ATP-dependent RNA helicase DeaD
LSNFQKFELNEQLLRGISSAGFTEPTPIQHKVIIPLLNGEDLIGQAKTGSGKTAAFGLPLLQKINIQRKVVQSIVLAPTRELAVQITEELRKIGKYTGIRILSIYGGQSINIQLRKLSEGVHVVVGTPGRVIDHIKRGTLQLDFVKNSIVDEADTMMDMGFIDDVEFILNTIPHSKQLSLFSATMPKSIIELSERYMDNPKKILVDSDEISVETLDQYYVMVEQKEKLTCLIDLLNKEKPKSSIIFCRTKIASSKLARNLTYQHLNAVALHGDLSQSQRDRSMYLFRTGRASILVATDIASRGIDIPQVDCVVNFDVPLQPLIYFHRVGRTARAGDSGKSFIFISKNNAREFARIQSLTKAVVKPFRLEDEQKAANLGKNRYQKKNRDHEQFSRKSSRKPRYYRKGRHKRR